MLFTVHHTIDLDNYQIVFEETFEKDFEANELHILESMPATAMSYEGVVQKLSGDDEMVVSDYVGSSLYERRMQDAYQSARSNIF